MSRYYSDMAHMKTCLYRLYSPDERLLYVGISMNLEGRLTKHHRRQWWPLVARCDVEWFEDRETAKAAEKAAIFSEAPIHNITRPAAGIQMRDITTSGDA